MTLKNVQEKPKDESSSTSAASTEAAPTDIAIPWFGPF